MANSSEKPFPLKEVQDALMAELLTLAVSEAEIQELTLPADPEKIALVKIRLDSLSVVDVTCILEPIMGFEPKNIVKTGGYESISAALEHMMPRLEAAWAKKTLVPA